MLDEKLTNKIEEVDARLSARMDKLDSRMDGLESRMDRLENRMDKLDSRMDGLESRMDKLENRMDKLDSRMDVRWSPEIETNSKNEWTIWMVDFQRDLTTLRTR